MGGGGSKPTKKVKFIEKYTVGKELGSGAFSVVKLATNKVTKQELAVKMIARKKLSAEDFKSLLMEIEILGSLNHAHIIRLEETFDEGNDYFIVTELVAGGELFDRIVAKAQYSEKEARDLVKIFLETMDFIHSKGIVHRDLKPENLLLCSADNDFDVKIADFGFAKRVTDLTKNETACGTPGYVAPEILRGDAYATEVDIWSMGVICYVLLAGYPPFYDDDQKKLFKKIKNGAYHFHEEYWGNTSPEAIDMIKHMLCVDQRKRWSAKQLLQHPWIKLGDDVLASKSLDQSIVTMKKFNARRRFRAAAHAVVMSNRMAKLLASFKAGMSEAGKVKDEIKKEIDDVALKKALEEPDDEMSVMITPAAALLSPRS